MKNTKRLLLPLLVALSLLAAPAVAFANTGLVHRALAGAVLDPAGTTMRVVPPKGGMVLVYRNGQAVGWLMRAGYLNLEPNRIYGVVATRGASVLFNAGLMLRPGLTELVWRGDSQPQISYLPAYQPYPNHVGVNNARPGHASGQHRDQGSGHHSEQATSPRPHTARLNRTHRTTARKLTTANKTRSRLPAKRSANAKAPAKKRAVSPKRANAPALGRYKLARVSR